MAYFEDYSWNVELSPEVIKLLFNFSGYPSDNPYSHIQKFEEICGTFSNLLSETVKLKYFEQSLRYKATSWFFLLNSYSTWQEVQNLFLEEFSPAYQTVLRKQQIVNNAQIDEESYFHCWERYKDLLLSFPDHGFALWHIIDFFYDGLNGKTRQLVDMICHGEFLDKTDEKDWDFYDRFAKNSKFWVCNMNYEDANSQAQVEEQVEPVGASKRVIDLELETIMEFELSDELNVQCSPQVNFAYSPEMTFDMKTLEEPLSKIGQIPLENANQMPSVLNHTSTPFGHPPLEEIIELAPIDFLGVDNCIVVYHPFFLQLINNLKVNLVWNADLVEFQLQKRLRQLRYSKLFDLTWGVPPLAILVCDVPPFRAMALASRYFTSIWI
ncbi:hypothetical protein RHMOL_Rhmol04G0236300 [Rhododendron molle]|uniref:Uncharacterized protein n=1 Tax=Rhododendron molle TaxID=49168 RepID=A0ACC0P4S9_RHOML|nr:hypothetical protein RHMOL_Rhmol04G0236300 [Rhododendron molle]